MLQFVPRVRRCTSGVALLAVLALGVLGAAPAGASQVELVSKADPPFPYATSYSYSPSLSAEGRFVGFLSRAGNLVPGQVDSFAGSDAFLHDRVTGVTTLLSHRDGLPEVATESSANDVEVSGDGRYAVFASGGADLVPGQTGASYYNLFLYDRLAGTTRMVSHAPGSPAAGGDGSSYSSRLSQDGRYVAFQSYAKNLVAGMTDPTNGGPHVFLWDRDTDTTVLLNHSHDGLTIPAGHGASLAGISADGAYVAFNSNATNLLPGTTFPGYNNHAYLYERATGTLFLVDHSSGAPTTPGDSGGYLDTGSLSADGRYALFSSSADDLLSGAPLPSGFTRTYLYDRLSGNSILVSHAPGQPTVPASGDARSSALSADGRFATFSGNGVDLVAGETGAPGNLFLWDRTTGAIRLISHAPGAPLSGTGGCDQYQVDPSGSYGRAWIDADGSHVAFRSIATNLVPGQTDASSTIDLFLWDRASDTTRLVSHTQGSTVTSATAPYSLATLSADGGTVVFDGPQTTIESAAADPYGFWDVFVYDRASQSHSLVSHAASPSRTPFEGWIYDYDPVTSISADGRFVTFLSDGIDLVPGQVDHLTNPDYEYGPSLDLFLHDRVAGTTVLLTHDAAAPAHAVGGSEGVVSADGRYVAFSSYAANLVAGEGGTSAGNVYLHDRVLGQTVLLSHANGSSTTMANGFSGEPVLSADGRYVAFQSHATNLIAGQVDTNQTSDVFLYDRTTGAMTLVSHAAGAATTACNSTDAYRPGPAISPDGRYVAFESGATDLVSGQVDTNGQDDVFLYDRLSGNVALVSHANGDPATAGNDQSLLSSQVSSHALLVTDDGHVVFLSKAKDLVAGQSGVPASPAVFLYDAGSGTTALVSHTAGSATLPAAGACDRPALSADGKSVAFDSTASDLMTGQVDGNGSYDAFLYDVTSGANTLVSHVPGSPGTAGNATSYDLSLSDDGQRVTFSSLATDLVQDQITRYPYTHVFLWHRDTGAVTLASHTAGVETTTGTDYSGRPVISGDGSAIAFTSFAGDLVGGDANGAEDVYVSTETTPGPPTGLFFTVSPCRLLDTRQGGGALPSGIHWPLAAAGSCHIPTTAVAVAVNVTAVRPTGEGFLTLHSSDVAAPLASSLNFGPGQTRTNNVVLPLATSPSRLGSFAISPFLTGNGAVDVVVDVFGYFE